MDKHCSSSSTLKPGCFSYEHAHKQILSSITNIKCSENDTHIVSGSPTLILHDEVSWRRHAISIFLNVSTKNGALLGLRTYYKSIAVTRDINDRLVAGSDLLAGFITGYAQTTLII